jgi:hypothetical protein
VLQIDYDSEGFPTGSPVANGSATLDTSWDDILWSALTIGRPNRQAVFQHGDASLYEAIFRLSLVRMALEQSGPRGKRLRRTDAARTLDPSEKGVVNFFIGMAMCKLFADRLLNTPWLLHVDTLRPALNLMLTGRSRPDLYGQRNSGEWIVMESKGRISGPDSTAKTRAKQQAQRFPSGIVAPASIQFRIGGITYLRSDVLQFYWRDPEPQREEPYTSIRFDPALWRFHWALALALYRAGQRIAYAEGADVLVAVHPVVLSFLQESRWAEAKEWCVVNRGALRESEFRSDGLKVVAGPSWSKPFDEVLGDMRGGGSTGA